MGRFSKIKSFLITSSERCLFDFLSYPLLRIGENNITVFKKEFNLKVQLQIISSFFSHAKVNQDTAIATQPF